MSIEPNPLYDLWARTMERVEETGWRVVRDGDRLNVPFDGPISQGEVDAIVRLHGVRRQAVNRYAWAVPTEEAVAAVARRGPVVEFGAGTGYWAMMLARAGADVVAYDAYPRHGCWFDVREGGPEVVPLHPDRTLFLCWPPDCRGDQDDPGFLALRAYTGGTVAYVGEDADGFTGGPRFHALLAAEWSPVEEVAVPQWDGIRDRLTVYERRAL